METNSQVDDNRYLMCDYEDAQSLHNIGMRSQCGQESKKFSWRVGLGGPWMRASVPAVDALIYLNTRSKRASRKRSTDPQVGHLNV